MVSHLFFPYSLVRFKYGLLIMVVLNWRSAVLLLLLLFFPSGEKGAICLRSKFSILKSFEFV